MGLLKYLLALLLVVTGIPSLVLASTDAQMGNAEFSFNHGSGFQNHQLGYKVIRDQVHDILAQYDFSKSGGAVGAISLRQPVTAGTPGGITKIYIPKNAIVTNCVIDVVTTVTSGGSATLAFGTGQSTTDLLAATGKSSFTAGSLLACTPVDTAATMIKMTADQSPVLTVATAALTAGKINVHIMYTLSDP